MSRVSFVVISMVPCATRSRRVSSLYGFSEKTDSLSFLDLSNNSIQDVEGLPSKAKIMLSLNHCPQDFAPGVLTEVHCLSLQKGTIPDRSPKALHSYAPERSRKYARLFSRCHSRPFFQHCLTHYCTFE